MSIDMSTPFDFLKTMRLSDYEHTDDFFSDLLEQLDLYATEKNKKIKELEAKLAVAVEALEYYANRQYFDDTLAKLALEKIKAMR